MENPPITRLPSELMHKIASFLPVNDLVALGTTCRHLHAVCNDSFVLQEAFIRHVTVQEKDKSTLRKLLVDGLSSKDAAEAKAIWRRLAAIAPLLPQLIDELETHLVPYESVPWDNSAPKPERVAPPVKAILGVLSTLTVLGHPTVNNFAVTAALTGLVARLLDPDFWQEWEPRPRSQHHVPRRAVLPAQLAFCLATGALGSHVLNNMPLLSYRVGSFWDPTSREAGIFRELCESFEGRQTVALLVVACLPWLLHADVSVRLRDDLPDPAALPLLKINGAWGRAPLPDGSLDDGMRKSSISGFGAADSWSNWLLGNVNALIDDLDQGEWVCYYTNSLSREGQVDAPLHKIHFVAQHELDSPYEVKLTAGDCVSDIGRCRIHGAVMRDTGKVSLVKVYPGGHAWHIEGTLTPLGIAGYWGSSPLRPIGFLWMYKREWARTKPRV